MKIKITIDMEIEGTNEMKKSLIKHIRDQISGEDSACGGMGFHDCRGFDKDGTPYWSKTLCVKVKKKKLN